MTSISGSNTASTPPPLPTAFDGRESPIGNLAEALDLALRQREFEITQLTQRNNFFMIFQGVLIAGIVQSQGTAAPIISFAVCVVGLTTSLLQVGMAAGSKFWQIRWERAAKTTEIWLLQELQDVKRVNSFFTADGNFLTAQEKTSLAAINARPARISDPVTHGDGDITAKNKEEITSDKDSILRQLENWLILKKYSVSRVPIWAAMFLGLFWLVLLLSMISINGVTLNRIPGWIDITVVPLKAEPREDVARSAPINQ